MNMHTFVVFTLNDLKQKMKVKETKLLPMPGSRAKS